MTIILWRPLSDNYFFLFQGYVLLVQQKRKNNNADLRLDIQKSNLAHNLH